VLALHLDLISFLDGLAVNEQVRVDFIRSWEDKVLAVLTVKNGNAQSVDELTFVDVIASPAGSLRKKRICF
jgi:hypothetical protein